MLYQENGCDAVLCRPGTFNIHGHATLHTACRRCPATKRGERQDPPASKVLGRTFCKGVAYVHGDLNGDGVLSPREVLRMLYIDTLGRFWGPEFQTWANMTYNECDLHGVTCLRGRITKLDLTSANMCSDGNRKPGPTSYCKGLPAEIGELRSLEALQLSRRQFLRGSLPTQIGKLTNLRLLDISSCTFMTGTIPSELGLLTHLKLLKIAHTQLRGSIPSSLFALSSLEVLHLTNNRLTGTVPPTKMVNLRELMIARNSLKGSLPSQVGELRKLENFEAYLNDLTGRIPSEFGSCSLLKRIGKLKSYQGVPIPDY
jgi:Leucine-rich repeat (LRR) protein